MGQKKNNWTSNRLVSAVRCAQSKESAGATNLSSQKRKLNDVEGMFLGKWIERGEKTKGIY